MAVTVGKVAPSPDLRRSVRIGLARAIERHLPSLQRLLTAPATIRTLVMAYAFILLVPILAYCLFLITTMRSGQDAHLASSVASEARIVARWLDREIEHMESLLRALRLDAAVFVGDDRDFHAHAKKVLRLQPSLSVQVVHPDGRVRLDTSQPFDAPRPASRSSAALREVVETGHLQVSDFKRRDRAIEGSFDVMLPLIRGDEVYAVIILTRAAAWKDDASRLVREAHGAAVQFFDLTGALFTAAEAVCPDGARQLRDLDSSAAAGLDRFTATCVPDPLAQTWVWGSATSLRTGWQVQVAVASSFGADDLRQSMTIFIVLGVLAILLSIGLGQAIAWRIVMPLQALTKVCDQITEGRVPHNRQFPLQEANTLFGSLRRSMLEMVGREQLIELSNARLSSIIDSAIDGIVGLDQNLRISFINAMAHELLPADVAIGRRIDAFIDIIAGGETSDFAADIARASATGRTIRARWAGRGREWDGPTILEIGAARVHGGDHKAWTLTIRDISDRARHEEESAKLAAMVRASPDAIYSLTTDGEINSWNEAAERLLGYTAEEIIGQRCDVLVPPDRLLRLHDANARLLSGLRVDVETVRRNKSGVDLDVEIHSAPMYSSSGIVIGIISVVRDIRDRRTAERRSAQLSSIVENSPDAIFSVGTDDLVQSWNPSAEALLGYTASQIIGQSPLLMMPVEFHATFDKALRRIRDGRGFKLRSVRRHKDGHLVQVDVTTTPMWNADGTYIGFSAVLRDRSKEVHAEEVNAHLASIVSSSPEPIISTDLDATITSWNRGAEQMFGYSQDQALGQRLSILVPPSDMEEYESRVAVLKAGTPVSFETTRLRKDGSPVRVIGTGTPIRNASGVVINWAFFYRDIGALARAEAFSRSIITASPDWTSVFKRDGRIVYMNNADVAGVPQGDASSVVGTSWEALWPAEEQPKIVEALSKVAEEGGYRFISSCRALTGNTKWWDVILRSVEGPADEGARILAMARDITTSKEREAHITFIMRELSHRAKNLLAVVSAMARSTASLSESLPDFERRFSSRLRSLAQSHDLLVQKNWEGVKIQTLLTEQLRPFVEVGSMRCSASGPEVMLTPEASQMLGLALHELATNAAKYGVLSAEGGHLDVRWVEAQDDKLGDVIRFDWQESGGPAVVPPTRMGFGRVVIEEMTGETMAGHAELSFAEAGVRWSLVFPTARNVPRTQSRTQVA